MIKLDKKANYKFIVSVNHGSAILDRTISFGNIDAFKEYALSLSPTMLAIRTLTVKNFSNMWGGKPRLTINNRGLDKLVLNKAKYSL